MLYDDGYGFIAIVFYFFFMSEEPLAFDELNCLVAVKYEIFVSCYMTICCRYECILNHRYRVSGPHLYSIECVKWVSM